MKNGTLINAFLESPWAILPETIQTLATVLRLHSQGIRVWDEDAAVKARQQRREAVSASGGAVGVIPIRGTIAQRLGLMEAMSGGASTEEIGQTLRAMIADDRIGSIVLDIDSPGGSVYGVEELATEIRELRSQKPITAVVNSMAASAAYWIASAASEIVMTPSGEVGSIGVLMVHEDQSAFLEKEGRRVTVIKAGKHKAEAGNHEPLTEDAAAFLQGRVDEYYSRFVGDVAKGRGVPVSTVRSDFGEGRMFGAKTAKAAGMVDRIDTMQATIQRLAGSRRAPGSRARATETETEIRARRMRRIVHA